MKSTDRYLLMDSEDMGNALSFPEIRCLLRLEQKVANYRRSNNKEPLQFGVVDTDYQNQKLSGQTVVEYFAAAQNRREPLNIEVSNGLVTITTGIDALIETFMNSYDARELGVNITNRAAFARDIATAMTRPRFYTTTNEAALEAISQGSTHATVNER